MPEGHDGETSRLITPAPPTTTKPRHHAEPEVEELLPPDYFDQRLSVDSKLSVPSGSVKGFSDSDPDAARRLSVASLHYRRASPSPGPGPYYHQPPESWSSRVVTGIQTTWNKHRGVLLVATSQLFGALMNLAARLLELEAGLHPFQVLFARQALTMTAAILYMWWAKTPDFPFGAKEVRWLLLMRGICGFFGIYGMWYSMLYLPLAEATVITFLAPSIAGIGCYIAFREPFTRVERIGTILAFLGVLLMAHPTSLFGGGAGSDGEVPADGGAGGYAANNGTAPDPGRPGMDHEATPAERLKAIAVALVGVLGAAGAFTSIRWIGKRAHPLLSVNYFATWCTLVSIIVLTAAPTLDIGQPDLRFALPQGFRQWFLLVFLGLMGFIMQFMLTAGLRVDRSNRANAMVFTHMLFAAGFDRWIFGTSMGWMSLAGCGLIIGGALYMVLFRDAQPKREGGDAEAGGLSAGSTAIAGGVRDTEAVPMLMDVDHNDIDVEDELDSRRTQLGG